MSTLCTVRNLSRLAYGQGFTLWHYKANPVPLSTVLEPGFFRHLGGDKLLRAGDMIMVSASDRGAVLYVVTADSDETGVTVREMCASASASAS